MISEAESTAVTDRDIVPTLQLSFIIPKADGDAFAELPDTAQRQVLRRLQAMRIIARAKSVNAGARQVAAAFHMERGWKVQTLNNLYAAFVKTGDWKTLLDKSMAGPKWWNLMHPVGLPDAFVDFLASQWAMNQRDKFMAVYAALLSRLDLWKADCLAGRAPHKSEHAIPGYDEPPLENPPAGWHYSNLKRMVNDRAGKYSRKLVQIGPKAASHIGPKILSTRAGLNVGQYYIFDDSWNDFKVIAYGQTVRLLSFHALDLFSGCNVMRGYKPALKDERDCEERLREREMIFMLVSLLTAHGYRAAGCTLICEKGTATIRTREEDILATHCPEIIVERGPRGGGAGIGGLFTGPGGGNPRWKAPLESWFNLLRNRTAGLIDFPGQTGSYSSGLPMPEGLPGLERDTQALIKAARTLPATRAELLKLGMLTSHEAIFALDAVTEVMCNCRTNHDLEGWRECNHFVQEWRSHLQMPWQRAEALLEYHEGEREAIAAQLANSPELKRERALSPREVFDAGKSDLVKIPMAVGALLMADLEGIERPVKQGVIEVGCPEVSTDEPLRFGLMRRDGRGTEEPLRDNQKYLVRVNPLDARHAWLFHADGSFAGIAPNYGRVQRTDTEGLQRAFGRKAKALAPLVEEARRMAAPITQAANERAAQNAEVFGPKPRPEITKDTETQPRPDCTEELLAREDSAPDTQFD